MQNIYKKLLFISLLTATVGVLIGCSSDISDAAPAEGRQEMRFVTADVSRAITSEIDYAGSRFALFGDMKYSTNSKVKVFDNIEVEYDGSFWNYADQQYWFPSSEYSFVAVHPAEALKDAADIQYSESKLSYTYALPLADNMILNKEVTPDFLVATHRRMYETGGNATVYLRFGHVMSLVNFAPAFYDNIMSEDDYILIHKLELSGVKTKARFDILPAPILSAPQTDDMVIDVTAQEPGNSTVIFPTPIRLKNFEKNLSLFGRGEAIMMFPQTFPADSEAKIIFYYSVNDEKTMKTVGLPLKNQNWASGRNYVYNFTIERTGIKLDNCEIIPWNEIRGTDITVE